VSESQGVFVIGDTRIGPEQLLRHLQVPGEAPDSLEPIYVLGSFERRVTLYSQQVRALNLAFALFETGQLKAGARVAVIGAGASGITAAIGLAHLGAKVELIERTDVLSPLQRACRTRWIHPHIYDWPAPGSEEDEATLPLVGWKAGYAHDIARVLEDALQQVIRKHRTIDLTLSATVQNVTGGARPQISWQGRRPAGAKVVRTDEEFEAAIIAVGFGVEEGTEQLPMSSYWRNDDLDQPVLKPQEDPIRCLVSGNGDGGLIDILRLRMRDFRLESLHGYLRDTLKPADLERLMADLRGWESEASKRNDAWLWDRYSKLDLPGELTTRLRHGLLRTDTKVWLAAARSPITFRSAILNRLWVALLVQHDDATTWVRSATQRVEKQGRSLMVTFQDAAATKHMSTTFDRVIVRHGPTSALTGALQWIDDRCRPVLKPRNALDETRWPIWKPDVTFGAQRAPVQAAGSGNGASEVGPAPAPGSAPVTVQPSMVLPGTIHRGGGVAVTEPASIQSRTSPAPPRPDDTLSQAPASRDLGLSMSVPPVMGGHRLDLREDARDMDDATEVQALDRPAKPLSGGLYEHVVTFLDHCRVDPDSVRSVTLRHTPRPPELRWHRSIQRPFELILRGADRLDDLDKLFPGHPRDAGPHLDVPMFEPAFFDDVERLVSAEQATRRALQVMWDFLADEPPEPRAAAVQTFAAFAALRMIARLRAFEGTLRIDDGQAIVNLFPDLPPIRSSWLLRRVPYRSRIGGLALGEEHFLLCRVAEAERDYNYFLLPRWIAESTQDADAGLPETVVAAWIVPQWFFQQYRDSPGKRQKVWVIVDEHGRERYLSSDPLPWNDDPEIEEKPHPTASLAVQQRELEPRWHVLTLPLNPRTGPRPAVPPLR
jgi:pyridine nucleotide-disulfide oxidoreductase